MPVTVKTQSSSAATCSFTLISQTSQSSCLDTIPTDHCHSRASISTDTYHLSSVSSINSRTQTGFTLVEIVVVVVILSIFAGIMSLSVGSSESRKNRAFYEHLTDSLSYVRLLSAERMQPMGLSMQAEPVIVTLSNPYVAYQTTKMTSDSTDSQPKNAMELSAKVTGLSGSNDEQKPTPSWEVESSVSLPALPTGVSIRVQNLDSSSLQNMGRTQTLQPWFSDQNVPQVLWFGTGQATPVTIEVLHDSRLVGEVITIMPDGSMRIGQGL
ncbi:prepilin-type N-terminal cleavage/methylation domain-containing protein [Psychrobacter sp. SIMBA_152]